MAIIVWALNHDHNHSCIQGRQTDMVWWEKTGSQWYETAKKHKLPCGLCSKIWSVVPGFQFHSVINAIGGIRMGMQAIIKMFLNFD